MGKLYDQILDFKIILKKFLKFNGGGIHISCKTKQTLDEYRDDVENNRSEFISKNPEVLLKIRLLKGFTFEKIKWDYLFEMYNTTLNENEKSLEIVDVTTDTDHQLDLRNNSMPGGIEGLLGNPAITGLISQLLPIVQETLKNKDTSNIKPEDLINALTSGNLKNNNTGIDLSNVFEKTTQLVNEKIASGELNF